MMRFLLKMGLFWLLFSPVLLYSFILPAYIGEAVNYQDIAQQQFNNPDLLFKQAYSDYFFGYKLANAQLRQPEVLAIGSSRTMQFRAAFFNKSPGVFYNAAGVGYNPIIIEEFLHLLTKNGTKPSLIIIGLDDALANRCFWENGSLPTTPTLDSQTPDLQTLSYRLSISRWILDDLLAGTISPTNLITRRDPVHGHPALGLHAIASGSGFRADGSFQYGGMISGSSSIEQVFERDWQNFQHEMPPYIGCDTVSTENLQIFAEHILQYAHAQGINVIGFSPPFAPSFYNAMVDTKRFQFLLDAPTLWQTTFEKYGFTYFDFTDVTSLGVADKDMVDAFHGSEWVYLLMYIQMVETLPEMLGQYSELAYLRAQAESAPNHYEVFESIYNP